MKPDVVALASNRSGQEAEAGELTVRGQPGVSTSQRLKQPLFVIYTTFATQACWGGSEAAESPLGKGGWNEH